MAKCNRGSHHPQPVDDTQILAVRAMLALSESELGDRLKQASDDLYRKYCTNGSRTPNRASRRRKEVSLSPW